MRINAFIRTETWGQTVYNKKRGCQVHSLTIRTALPIIKDRKDIFPKLNKLYLQLQSFDKNVSLLKSPFFGKISIEINICFIFPTLQAYLVK